MRAHLPEEALQPGGHKQDQRPSRGDERAIAVTRPARDEHEVARYEFRLLVIADEHIAAFEHEERLVPLPVDVGGGPPVVERSSSNSSNAPPVSAADASIDQPGRPRPTPLCAWGPWDSPTIRASDSIVRRARRRW